MVSLPISQLVDFLFRDLTSLHPPSFQRNDFSTCIICTPPPACLSAPPPPPVTTWAKKDVDEEVKFGLTAMVENGRGGAVFIATSLGEGDLLREFLTKYPAMVDHASDGRTPLHYAASAGLAKPMKILLEFNANIELQVCVCTCRKLLEKHFHSLLVACKSFIHKSL